MAHFVQFPHPGTEHRPSDDHMPWNVGDHRRKFLRSPGRFLCDDGSVDTAELVFWAEWEPPSLVERRWPRSGDLPRYLHRPYWIQPMGGRRQNTDPWVFGDQMLYSNCRQTLPSGAPSALQQLDRGSIICFGSTLGGAFCVDTVFVVADAEPWNPDHSPTSGHDPAFQTCTADAITSGGCATPGPLTLYYAATIENPVEGMYSFVPARRADDPTPRFARPAVTLDGLINPASTQSARGARQPHPLVHVRKAWDTLRQQVLDADVLLGVWFQVPERRDDEDIPPSDRTSC